ncbi:MAG: pirin family protein [Thiohalomonadales bacterium]
MLVRRDAKQRGHANHGWLDSHHTFSFAQYHDPEHVQFRQLRVINEDKVTAAQGFPTHSHRDMEIITYVIDGAIEHKDSMGNSSVIKRGEVQRMSAGTGVSHSEYNHHADKPLHFFQIWIIPEKTDLLPGYEQKAYVEALKPNSLCLIGSAQGGKHAVKIHQDVELYTARMEPGSRIDYAIKETRYVWMQLVNGDLTVNGKVLHTGDGLAVQDESMLNIKSSSTSEFLLFDLA